MILSLHEISTHKLITFLFCVRRKQNSENKDICSDNKFFHSSIFHYCKKYIPSKIINSLLTRTQTLEFSVPEVQDLFQMLLSISATELALEDMSPLSDIEFILNCLGDISAKSLRKFEVRLSEEKLRNGIITSALSNMTNLKILVLPNVCRDEYLGKIGASCPFIQNIDVRGSERVSDLGIQNLVFPPIIHSSRKISLSNKRTRTNLGTKHIWYIDLGDTNVSEIGLIMLLQFCPRIPIEGQIISKKLGTALKIMSQKMGVKNICTKELWFEKGMSSLNHDLENILNPKGVEVLRLDSFSKEEVSKSLQLFSNTKDIYLEGTFWDFADNPSTFKFIRKLHIIGNEDHPLNLLDILSQLMHLMELKGTVFIESNDCSRLSHSHLNNAWIKVKDKGSFNALTELDLPCLESIDIDIIVNPDEFREQFHGSTQPMSVFRNAKYLGMHGFSPFQNSFNSLRHWLSRHFPYLIRAGPIENWVQLDDEDEIYHYLKSTRNTTLVFNNVHYSMASRRMKDLLEDPEQLYHLCLETYGSYGEIPKEDCDEIIGDGSFDWEWGMDGQIQISD